MAFFVSFILLYLSYIAAHHYFGTAADPLSEKEFSITPERVAVFLDAVFAGIVAFALLGAFTFVFSLRRPDEETIEDRVAYLYSARRDESPAANKFLMDSVTLLGATVHEAKMYFTVVQVDETKVKTDVRVEMTIMNMMKHDVYKQDMPLRISLDPLEGFDRDLGMITLIRTTPFESDNRFGNKEDILKAPVRLTNSSPTYSRKIKLEIPACGGVLYEYAWHGWGPKKDLNFCGANRFAEHVTIYWKNATETPFKILRPDAEDTKGRQVTAILEDYDLQPNGEVEADFHAVPPATPIAFWLAPV